MKLQIASGSVVGSDHRKKNLNNQDSFLVHQEDDLLIAIVSDGCGSSLRSDVGSQVLCELLKQVILEHKSQIGTEYFLQLSFERLCDKLSQACLVLGFQDQDIEKYFQASLVCCIVYEEQAYIFSCGDGMYIVNDDIVKIEPQENNSPVYPVYRLIPTTFSPEVLEKELKFHLHYHADLSYVDYLMIGTDGVEDYIEVTGQNIFRTQQPIAPINELARVGKYFTNPVALGNYLNIVNEYEAKVDWDRKKKNIHFGYLKDDVTMIFVKNNQNILNNEEPTNSE